MSQETGMGRLKGKVAFITGGARGQGRAIAEKFAGEGADIVICDVCERLEGMQYPGATLDDLEETRRRVEAQGSRCIAEVADVRDLAALEVLARRAVDELGAIDVLCANAGMAAWVPALETSEAQWREMLDVNLTGAFLTVKAVAPHMVERQSGCIILTSSVNGREAANGLMHYVVSKHGVIGLMRNLALELGVHRIRVNAVLPSVIHTHMGHNEANVGYIFGRPECTDEEYLEATRNWHLLRNLPAMSPKVVADAMIWLASDEARAVTGIELPVDGGHLTLPGFNHDAVVEALDATQDQAVALSRM
jgi:SDR family mycofactocin-dependent oxidoreductase